MGNDGAGTVDLAWAVDVVGSSDRYLVRFAVQSGAVHVQWVVPLDQAERIVEEWYAATQGKIREAKRLQHGLTVVESPLSLPPIHRVK